MSASPHESAALDVSTLPSFGFSHRSLVWWATLGLIAVESTVFGLAIASYFFLRAHSSVWPMNGPPPELFWGTVNTLVMLLSGIPNHLTKKAAEKLDLRRARFWLVVCAVFAAVFLVLRIFEFRTLNTGWDQNAYGSITWTLLALHTAHLVTDFWDTVVLAALLFATPFQGKSMVDVSENAFYWYFVVLSWLPIYFVVYWAPRLH
jgi:heme/copper-type cytochrome/quinol oxidase subunit 3